MLGPKSALKKISLIILLTASFAFKSQAILVLKLADLNTMALKSDVVMHGYVGEQQSEIDQWGRVVTISKVEVIDALYGVKTGEVISLYQVGGSKDGVIAPIIGGQHYQVGQEIIFFGLKAGLNFVSFGAGQGKLDIESQAGRDMIREDIGDAVAFDSQNKVYRPSPLTFNNVDILKSEIRSMLQQRSDK
ncbi:MAG: hypothetical protein KC505_09330 [Myxococcales bacterium]|nr:hypothetical protein [Myxococcales bacterium]USN51071.1 MAG: hypothetical protein H6731_01280 [Myxococcales bacterium]